MRIFDKILKMIRNEDPPKRIRITRKNISSWPKFEEMYEKGNVRFDSKGRLRYEHGAPVGDLVLYRINKDGTAKYKESAEEWFDTDSQMAKQFKWP